MIFQALMESAGRGELILVDGGICRFRVRKDGQITIGEILSLRPGAGTQMLDMLKAIGKKKRAWCIFAKCPDDLPSNDWYEKKGFEKMGEEKLRTGSVVNLWRLVIGKRRFAGFFQ